MITETPRALVVEDDRTTREVLGTYLAMLGYHVNYAGNVAQAVALVQGEAFDVLLVKAQLPDREGWDLLSDLRAQTFLPATLISMSAHASAHEQRRSKAAGCTTHLVKPFLVMDVERALRGADARPGLALPMRASEEMQYAAW